MEAPKFGRQPLVMLRVGLDVIVGVLMGELAEGDLVDEVLEGDWDGVAEGIDVDGENAKTKAAPGHRYK